mmetsp:Transcript_20613/g.52294  ORF Transcript_20613/g.52294 Transcript_20613/m.52294 type:complete len:141 (+) Transcript_20613:1533-1955(+)
MTQGQVAFELEGCLYTVLSRQSVVMPDGSQVSSLLLQATRPAATFGPEDVAATMAQWSGLTVTCAQPLGRPLIEAFQRCGVKAVIAPPEDLPSEVLPAVSEVLLTALHHALAGEPLAAALRAASEQHGLAAQGVTPLVLW